MPAATGGGAVTGARTLAAVPVSVAAVLTAIAAGAPPTMHVLAMCAGLCSVHVAAHIDHKAVRAAWTAWTTPHPETEDTHDQQTDAVAAA